jgi:integrase
LAGIIALETTMEKGKKAETGAAQEIAINFAWKLKKEGYAESTIKDYGYCIAYLLKKGANLLDPETVKEVMARQQTWSTARKANIVKAYTLWLKTQNLDWSAPRYRPIAKLPFIPLEKELDDLIAGCSRQMSAFLQLLKETAARCGEAHNLRWTDVDLVQKTVNITPEKHSEPRVFKISDALASMLVRLQNNTPKVFTYKNTFYLRKTFAKQRKRIAHKLGNPRILRIHFHTFRHWKATMLYHQTKDILYVMRFLGHKNIKNTLIYVQLAEMVSKGENEYICKVAENIEQAKQLVEAGFDYVTEINETKIFRKRK